MVEITLAELPDEAPAAAFWLAEQLKEIGATPMTRQEGVAGFVEAGWTTFRLPDGATLEAWSDNCTALSLRGPADIVERLAASYRMGQRA